MIEQDLLSLVHSEDLAALESAWAEETGSPGEVARYRQVLRELCERNAVGPALGLAKSMVAALAAADRHEDARILAETAVDRGAHDAEMARMLFDVLESLYAHDGWYPIAQRLSGLSREHLDPAAFAKFDAVRRLTPGHALYHRGGWGEGVVEELDPSGPTVHVRFANGSRKEFPLESALDTLRSLDDDDLRAMKLLRLEELQELAERQPAVLIRKAAAVYRGTITSSQVKSELSPAVIPTKKWATWWKKAKTAAANDPWLQVEGSATRPVFVLRKRPLTLENEAERELDRGADLGEAIAICRAYVARGLDERARNTILDLAQRRVEAALQRKEEPAANLLDAILFLEQHGRPTSVPAAAELRTLLETEAGFMPEAFERLGTQEAKEHAAALLKDALGPGWEERCITEITRFPASVVETVVDLLQEAGREGDLLAAWSQVAPYPRRHPVLTYLLGRLYADGAFDARPEAPDLTSVCRVVLHLCRLLAKEAKGDARLTRIKTRAASLLVGRRALLLRCLDDIDRDTLAAFLGIAERGGPDFPQEVTDAILRVVARKYPDITSRPERPFWEDDEHVYVTANGYARQKEEHRVLVDERIPLNAQAIQAAASYGDLSENAEWEAAMEEQRNLTGRAEAMSRELRMARLIEDQDLPDGVCAPGTKVVFRYLDGGERQAYRILGPWDCVEEDIVNYRAPIAGAFLGRRAGDESVVEGPAGERRVVIEAVERIV